MNKLAFLVVCLHCLEFYKGFDLVPLLAVPMVVCTNIAEPITTVTRYWIYRHPSILQCGRLAQWLSEGRTEMFAKDDVH